MTNRWLWSILETKTSIAELVDMKTLKNKCFNIHILDSDAASQLDEEKKTARNNRTESRRRKFQSQDSVINMSFITSQARASLQSTKLIQWSYQDGIECLNSIPKRTETDEQAKSS